MLHKTQVYIDFVVRGVLAKNELGEPIFATPAVSAEGILYVRTPSALYAFAER